MAQSFPINASVITEVVAFEYDKFNATTTHLNKNSQQVVLQLALAYACVKGITSSAAEWMQVNGLSSTDLFQYWEHGTVPETWSNVPEMSFTVNPRHYKQYRIHVQALLFLLKACLFVKMEDVNPELKTLCTTKNLAQFVLQTVQGYEKRVLWDGVSVDLIIFKEERPIWNELCALLHEMGFIEVAKVRELQLRGGHAQTRAARSSPKRSSPKRSSPKHKTQTRAQARAKSPRRKGGKSPSSKRA